MPRVFPRPKETCALFVGRTRVNSPVSSHRSNLAHRVIALATLFALIAMLLSPLATLAQSADGTPADPPPAEQPARRIRMRPAIRRRRLNQLPAPLETVAAPEATNTEAPAPTETTAPAPADTVAPEATSTTAPRADRDPDLYRSADNPERQGRLPAGWSRHVNRRQLAAGRSRSYLRQRRPRQLLVPQRRRRRGRDRPNHRRLQPARLVCG